MPTIAELKIQRSLLCVIILLITLRLWVALDVMSEETQNKMWINSHTNSTCTISKRQITKTVNCDHAYCKTEYELFCTFSDMNSDFSYDKYMGNSQDETQIYEYQQNKCSKNSYVCYVSKNYDDISLEPKYFDSSKYSYEQSLFFVGCIFIILLSILVMAINKKIRIAERTEAYVQDVETGLNINRNIEMQSLETNNNTNKRSSYITTENEHIAREIDRLNINSLPNIPVHFICPITQQIMIDPVVCTDGNTYERSEIETWIERKKTSPISRMHCKIICENRNLKGVIFDFLKHNGCNITTNNDINDDKDEKPTEKLIEII